LVEALCYQLEGSIPDEVIGIFHWLNATSHIMALSTQRLTEMSTRSVSRVQR